MCVLISCTAVVWHIYYSEKNLARYDQQCTLLSMCSVAYCVQILTKHELWGQFFLKKYSNIKFNENPSSSSRVVQCGQADGRTDMTKLIVAFRNVVNAPNNDDMFFDTVGSSAHVSHHSVCPGKQVAGDTRVVQEVQRWSLARQTPLPLRFLIMASL